MTQIGFYKDYYRAITYFNRGLEQKVIAAEKGEGMGTAGGIIKYAINILAAAEKQASDAGTK